MFGRCRPRCLPRSRKPRDPGHPSVFVRQDCERNSDTNGPGPPGKFKELVNSSTCNVNCCLCKVFDRSQQMSQAMGNQTGGYIENQLQLYQVTGSSSAGWATVQASFEDDSN